MKNKLFKNNDIYILIKIYRCIKYAQKDVK